MPASCVVRSDSCRSIPFSTSEARLAKNLFRSNPFVFEGVAEHGNVGIGALVLVLDDDPPFIVLTETKFRV